MCRVWVAPTAVLLVALLAGGCGDSPRRPALSTPESTASASAPTVGPAGADATDGASTPTAPIRPELAVASVEVPPIAARTATIDDAIAALREAGLEPAVAAVPFLSEWQRPEVVGTEPAAGEGAPYASTVTVVTSEGPNGSGTCPLDDVPDPLPRLVGRSLGDALGALQATTLHGFSPTWSVPGGLPALPSVPQGTAYLAAFTVTAQTPAPATPVLHCDQRLVELAVAAAPPAGTATTPTDATNDGRPLQVPRLRQGSSLDSAIAALGAAGLGARIPASRGLSSRRALPTLTAVRPAAGAAIAADEAVQLVLRAGAVRQPPACTPAEVVVPDVNALRLSDAIVTLEAAGLRWHTAPLAALPPDPARTGYLSSYVVVAHAPENTRAHRCATDVRLNTRPAPRPKQSLVPKVGRYDGVDHALLLLRRAGLVGAVEDVPAFTSRAGLGVAAIRPGPGRVVPSGTTVTLTLGEGPIGSPVCPDEASPPVPPVTGLTLADALGVLTHAGLDWSVNGGLPALSADATRARYLDAFTVTTQAPAAGQAAPRCTLPVMLTVTATPPA